MIDWNAYLPREGNGFSAIEEPPQFLREVSGRESPLMCSFILPRVDFPPVQVCVPGKAGRLFTLFLTSPVMGMAALVKMENADGLTLAACQVSPPHRVPCPSVDTPHSPA